MSELTDRAYKFRRFDRDCTCPGLLRELAETVEKLEEQLASATGPADQRATKHSYACHGCGYYGYKEPGDREGWCKHPKAPKGEVVRPTDHCDDFKAWKMPAEEKKTLPWVYCECGCKGWELSLGGRYFWMYWDLGKKWYLSRQHGMLYANGPYASAPAVERLVLDELRRTLSKLEQDKDIISMALAMHPDEKSQP
jgi:hypothetical protein